jgi:hypothetical protein
MHLKLTIAVLVFGVATLACGDAPPAKTSQDNASVSKPAATPAAGTSDVSVVSSHGGQTSPASPSGQPGTSDKPPVETPELDEKVEKAVAKAKSAGASADEKQAAADAYLARGDFFYNAQDKRLYRYALGDFRRALRYDPDNSEAKSKIETIESIYESLGRPIPTNGLEP